MVRSGDYDDLERHVAVCSQPSKATQLGSAIGRSTCSCLSILLSSAGRECRLVVNCARATLNHSRIADLDELALRCRDTKARTYLSEAIASYKAGAMRSAIIATWIAVAFDFIDKLNTLEAQGDKQAAQFAAEFRKIRDAADVAGSLSFERQILDRACKDLALISSLEYEDLSRLYQDRHRCAHPSMISDEELYQPTAEQVRYHMRTAVNAMLSQPPTSGKAALDQLVAQVRGPYFALDEAKALVLLEHGVLRRPRESLVRNFAIVLMKMIADPGIGIAERQRAAAALGAVRKLHPANSDDAIGEKLVGILRSVQDENLEVAIAAVAQINDAVSHMTDDLKTRFSQYIDTVPEDQLAAIAGYGLAVSFLKDATIARVCGVSNRNFAASISEASSLARHSEVRKRAIDIYRSAGSFDQANSMAKLIVMPLTSAFTEEEIKEVATAGFNNGQICYSHEFTRVLQALRSNPLVQKEWWDPFLQTLGANSSHPEAFFQAPTEQTDLTDAEPKDESFL